MGAERRVGIKQLEIPLTTSMKGRRATSVSAKGIPITRSMVWGAYKKVRSNKGSAGVDGERFKIFQRKPGGYLYRLRNRLTSGRYFPQAVKEVSIPRSGKKRKLATVEDRIAQQVIKDYLEARFEQLFHDNSYAIDPCEVHIRLWTKYVKMHGNEIG